MTTEPTTAPSQIPPPLRAALEELLRPLSEGIGTANEQLTDLPVLSERQASTRLDLRQDLREVRQLLAKLPGIRARQDEQNQRLAEISSKLGTLIELLGGEQTRQDQPEPSADRPHGEA